MKGIVKTVVNEVREVIHSLQTFITNYSLRLSFISLLWSYRQFSIARNYLYILYCTDYNIGFMTTLFKRPPLLKTAFVGIEGGGTSEVSLYTVISPYMRGLHSKEVPHILKPWFYGKWVKNRKIPRSVLFQHRTSCYLFEMGGQSFRNS